MLQEDVPSETLKVLRQISQQTIAYQLLPNGMLNATITIPPSSDSSAPFQPPPGAVLVNVLWFASLVFSLSTASIGILVKQWLRSYTTYKTSSAQGRMRVRHFRRHGMEIWKVYEIAAALPFLIQLALGLFFVGLCYFTAEVHPSLGRTTVPLVTGWALFLFAVTVLPIFSPYCPYKAALFEDFFSSVRQRIFSAISSVKAPDGLRRWARRHSSLCEEAHRPYDEADAVQYAHKDVDILIAADALQSDDELLGTAMLDALKLNQITPQNVVTFVLGALRNRTPWEGRFEDDPTCIDCNGLTHRAWTAIVDILAQTCGDILLRDMNLSTKHARWAVYLLLSPSQHLNTNGLLFLGRPLLHWDWRFRDSMIPFARTKSLDTPVNTIRKLLSALCYTSGVERTPLSSVVNGATTILYPYLEEAQLPTSLWEGAISLVADRKDSPSEWGKYLNEQSLREVVEHIADRLSQEITLDSDWSQCGAIEATLAFIFRLSALVHLAEGLPLSPVTPASTPGVATKIMADPNYPITSVQILLCSFICQPGTFVVRGILEIFTGLYNTVDERGASADIFMMKDEPLIITEVFCTVSPVLMRLHTAVNLIITDRLSKDFRIPHVIHLCYVVIFMFSNYDNHQFGQRRVRVCRSIIRQLTIALKPMPLEEHTLALGDVEILKRLLSWMHSMDLRHTDYLLPNEDEQKGWKAKFNPQNSMFSNHFIITLLRLSTEPAYLLHSLRAQILEEMSDEERLVAAADDKDDLLSDQELEAGITDDDVEGRFDGQDAAHRLSEGVVERGSHAVKATQTELATAEISRPPDGTGSSSSTDT